MGEVSKEAEQVRPAIKIIKFLCFIPAVRIVMTIITAFGVPKNGS